MPDDPGLVPFFGVIDGFLPASGPGLNDHLYRARYEDGDCEEYFEDELGTVLELYDQLKGVAHNKPHRELLLSASRDGPPQWTDQHPAVGARVCKFFTGVLKDDCSSASVEECLPSAVEPVIAAARVGKGEDAKLCTALSEIQSQQPGPDSGVKSANVKSPPKPTQQQRRSVILLESQDQPAAVATHRRPNNALDHQLLGTKRPVEISQGPVAVALDGPRIKKKVKAVELDDDHSLASAAPSGRSNRGTAAQSTNQPAAARTGGAARQGGFAVQAPLRPDRCVNANNVPIVRFFEDCLEVMARHKANIERARRRTFETKVTLPRDVAHQLVEDMAGDLIKSIRNHLDDERTSTENING